MKIELRKISMRVPQNNWSIQFTAQLFIDGNYVGDTSNDGNGGPCVYTSLNMETEKIIRDTEKLFKNLAPGYLTNPDQEEITVERSLENQISDISYTHYNQKILDKQMQKGFLFGQNGLNQWVEFEEPISNILKKPNGEKYLNRIFDSQVIPLMKKGDVLLNQNLPSSITSKLNETQFAKNPSRRIMSAAPNRKRKP